MTTKHETTSKLPLVEVVGQYSADEGATSRVIMRDAKTCGVIRGLGGLTEERAEELAREWAEEIKLSGPAAGG